MPRRDFEDVWENIRGRLMLDAMRMYRNRDDAEDAVSDVFVKVFTKYSDLPRGEIWLVARTCLLNAYYDRVRQRFRRSSLLESHVSRTRPKRDRSFDAVGSAADFESVATPQQMTVISMLAMGYSHKEIAEACGVSKSTVNVWLWKVRNKMSDMTSEEAAE